FQIRPFRRKTIDYATAETKADNADVAIRFRIAEHERHRCGRCGGHILRIGFGMQIARPIPVGRRTTGYRQEVGSKSKKALERKPPRDILDMRIETTIFMDDDSNGALALCFGSHQVAADLAFG